MHMHPAGCKRTIQETLAFIVKKHYSGLQNCANGLLKSWQKIADGIEKQYAGILTQAE